MMLKFKTLAAAFGVLGASVVSAAAAPVTAEDLGARALGAFVVGPVGQTVDSSFLTDGDSAAPQSIGDFSGGAACPAGFSSCVPPDNPAGTPYTYVQTVVPGADVTPNDAPFPTGETITAGVIESYALGFAPDGFTGVAGYDFAGAEANGLRFEIERDDATGALIWRSVGADWTDQTPVTFFFEAVAPPSGPGGRYLLNGTLAGAAAGPLPAAVAADVPVPASLPLIVAGLAALGMLRARRV